MACADGGCLKIRTRIAPTPSGYLHLGNAWSFVLTWLAARSEGGDIHLRIDDLDAARFREEYLEDVFASLRWLGLDWDGGPRDAAEFRAVHSQRFRIDRYREVLGAERLQASLYACVCSREQARRDAEKAGRPTLYAGTCRDRGLDLNTEDHALRHRVSKGAVKMRDETGGVSTLHPERDVGDFVVRQKNGDPGYQLASVVDDEDMHINFIVRGFDLMPSTGAQLCLARTLEWQGFPQARFWHHTLVLNDAGEKLSKSEGAESLKALREKFPDPSPIYRFFARYMGMDPRDKFSARDLLAGFRVEKVATMPLKLSEFFRESGVQMSVEP